MQVPGSPQGGQGAMRPQWSGETHPALAQVPRTPQQLQHLQRLQMQREQQLGDPSGQQQMHGQPQVQMQQQFISPQQQGMMPNGSNNKTKAALANMLSNRLQQPGQPNGGPPMQPPPPGGGPAQPPMAPDGSAATRLQLMNQQLQQQHQGPQMMGGPPPPPGAMYPQQGGPPQRHPYMMQPQGPPHMPPGAAMGPRGFPPQHRMPLGPGGGPTGGPPRPPHMAGMHPGQQGHLGQQQPRIQFHGHDPNTRCESIRFLGYSSRMKSCLMAFFGPHLMYFCDHVAVPPDLCLLGCIFLMVEYQSDPELAPHVDKWAKTIREYGGELEEEYKPRYVVGG